MNLKELLDKKNLNESFKSKFFKNTAKELENYSLPSFNSIRHEFFSKTNKDLMYEDNLDLNDDDIETLKSIFDSLMKNKKFYIPFLNKFSLEKSSRAGFNRIYIKNISFSDIEDKDIEFLDTNLMYDKPRKFQNYLLFWTYKNTFKISCITYKTYILLSRGNSTTFSEFDVEKFKKYYTVQNSGFYTSLRNENSISYLIQDLSRKYDCYGISFDNLLKYVDNEKIKNRSEWHKFEDEVLNQAKLNIERYKNIIQNSKHKKILSKYDRFIEDSLEEIKECYNTYTTHKKQFNKENYPLSTLNMILSKFYSRLSSSLASIQEYKNYLEQLKEKIYKDSSIDYSYDIDTLERYYGYTVKNNIKSLKMVTDVL